MSQQAFDDIVKHAGIPTDEAAMKKQFQQVADDNGVVFNNNSDYSPFWRMILALVTTPVLWLINVLKTDVLPNVYAKTAKDGFLDLIAYGVSLSRKLKSKAQGEITFTRNNSSGELPISAGTIIQSAAINGTVYEVVTLAYAVIADGSDSLKVNVEAVSEGAAWNLAAGYYSILAAPIAGIVSVVNENDWLLVPGDDSESNDDLRLRIRNQFSAVNQYHTDAVYRALIAANTGIRSDYIWFEHGAPRGPGSANAYILFDAGVPTTSYIDTVNVHVRDDGNHGHGDDVMCYAIPETQHDVVLDVWPIDNLSTENIAVLKIQVEFFIQAAFRESTDTDYQPTQTLPWSRFSFSRLGQELHKTFPDIDSLSFTNTDVTSEMTIPRLNSLTVTMQ